MPDTKKTFVEAAREAFPNMNGSKQPEKLNKPFRQTFDIREIKCSQVKWFYTMLAALDDAERFAQNTPECIIVSVEEILE